MIYFIKDPLAASVKIGFSKKPWKRFDGIQVSCAATLVMVGILDGDMGAEADLHKRFAAHHHRGEWFRLEGALAEFIQSLPAPALPAKRKTAKPTDTPLRAWRLGVGRTLVDLAREVDITHCQLSRVERYGTHSLPLALSLRTITSIPIEAFAPTGLRRAR